MGEHTVCRVCGSELPAPFLDLGKMPLANSFLQSPEEFQHEPSFPLAVAECVECGLVQLNYVVPAEQLYRHYLYVSATSDAVRRHAERLSDNMIRRYGWGPADLVVEVASNDGTVLKAFQRRGVGVLGVEPALNIADMAERNGVPTVSEFFTEETARRQRERGGAAAGILARHVFAHVNDVHDFLRGVSALLAPEGVFIVEVPYLGDMITNLEFDTIYHEHLSYISLRPVIQLCQERGLCLVDVEPVDLHGGSVLLHICRQQSSRRPSEAVIAMVREEERRFLNDPGTLLSFAARVQGWRKRFEGVVSELQGSGAEFIGYGAAAKANTLLNYCPEAARALKLILDRNPLKHGRYTPGTHIPVQPVEQWTSVPATHMLVLAWNFKDEIMRQMKPFAEKGGRFVIPIPAPTVV